jgi:hypothetical protein
MAYLRNNQNPANATPIWDIGGVSPAPPGYDLVSYTQVTSLAAATALTPPTDATFALVQVQDGVVRYRPDGVDPTASVGMLLYATAPATPFSTFTGLKFINATGSTALLNIFWYKPGA